MLRLVSDDQINEMFTNDETNNENKIQKERDMLKESRTEGMKQKVKNRGISARKQMSGPQRRLFAREKWQDNGLEDQEMNDRKGLKEVNRRAGMLSIPPVK